MTRARDPFLLLWLVAIVATTTAFVVHLAIRVESMQLGYELGQAHAHLGRLREVKRVLALELASYKTPERVERVARTLLGMSEPSADRIVVLGRPPPGALPPGTLPPATETESALTVAVTDKDRQ